MKERTVEALAQRLDRLERENRRLKRLTFGGLFGIAAIILMGQAMPGGQGGRGGGFFPPGCEREGTGVPAHRS